jgi:hypothetical protein
MKIGTYTLSNWWYISSTKRKKMDPEAKQRKQSALKTLLRQLDVPAMRTDVTSVSNLRWLIRNLAARNNEHRMLDTVFTMIRELLRS